MALAGDGKAEVGKFIGWLVALHSAQMQYKSNALCNQPEAQDFNARRRRDSLPPICCAERVPSSLHQGSKRRRRQKNHTLGRSVLTKDARNRLD